jgi:hypothetical protein
MEDTFDLASVTSSILLSSFGFPVFWAFLIPNISIRGVVIGSEQVYRTEIAIERAISAKQLPAVSGRGKSAGANVNV